MDGCMVCGLTEYMEASLKRCCSRECARVYVMLRALDYLDSTLAGLVEASNPNYSSGGNDLITYALTDP